MPLAQAFTLPIGDKGDQHDARKHFGPSAGAAGYDPHRYPWGGGIDAHNSTLTFRRTATALAVTAGLAVAAYSQHAAATLVTYTYTGNNYNSVFGSYDTDMRVEGWFIIDDYWPLALGPARLFYDSMIVDYSFSDGLYTLTKANSQSQFVFLFDNNLAIAEASVYLNTATSVIQISLDAGGKFSRASYDEYFLPTRPNGNAGAEGGTWSGPVAVTSPVPVPAALPIIGAALAGFGFAGWRQRKTAA